MHSINKTTLKRINTVVLAALLIVATGSSFADAAGSIHTATGYVTVTSSDGEVRRLKPGDKLQNGDVINTGNESSVAIVLASGEMVNLGALDSYTVGESIAADKGGPFAQRSIGNKSPTLSTATSAGGSISDAPTTPEPGGSPTN